MPNCIFRPLGTDGGDLDDQSDNCLATGVGGLILPESVEITNVCQDPNDVNLIYLEVNIIGVFDYTPELRIQYVDRNGNPREVNITSRFVFNYANSPDAPGSFPIQTNCTSTFTLLAYDVGRIIPDFGLLGQMTVQLKMDGAFDTSSFDQEILAEISEVFQSINPTAEYLFTKGLSPRPYALFFDEISGELRLQYANLGGLPCSCDIVCADISEEGQDLILCSDEIQEVSVSTNSIVGDPTLVSLAFRDTVGNTTDFSAQLVHQTNPKRPDAFRITDDNPHIQVNPFFVTDTGTVLDHTKLDYQIWKYEGNESNTKMIQDWSSNKWTTYIDYDISATTEYGYAVRFRGEFGEVSRFSSWITIMGLIALISLSCIFDFGTFNEPVNFQEVGSFSQSLLDCDLGTF
jgi:hypothetical protein